MRILWLKADFLLPLDKGGKLRTWHLLRHLAKRHDVTFFAFTDRTPPPDVERMRDVAAETIVVPRVDPPKGSGRFYLDASRHLLDPLPYAVGKYRSRVYLHELTTLLQTRAFDVLVCDFLVPAVNLPRRVPCPTVLFTHNVESEIWRRHADTAANPIVRLLYRAQHRRMRRFEGRTLARFDGVLAVSDADRETFTRLYPGAVREPIRVVPTGVDTGYFTPAVSAPHSRRLVFTGSMDWLPNEDAMLYFCREVLPLIRATVPDVALSIVGRAPTPAVLALAAQAGVDVTGRVEDVRPFMADAAVYVVPLRIGGGTRLKIFEAMAMGKAVVSTTVGAEGLPVTSGEHLAIADDAPTFAAEVVALLRNVDRRRRLESAARTLVVAHYDWSVAAAVLDRALARFSGRPAVDRIAYPTPISPVGIES